jgi:hypothetical protein
MRQREINLRRLALGGGAAAIVIFAVTGVWNGILFAADLQAWMHDMGGQLHPLPQPIAATLWATMCVVYGMSGVWLYAEVQSRYGARARTAAQSGFALWIVAKLAVALDLFAIGLLPLRIDVGQALGSLVALVLGVTLGARLYSELQFGSPNGGPSEGST